MIKHRDEFAKEGDGDDDPRGGPIGRLRPLDGGDRRGQGQGAKAVHAGESGGKAKADAVWHSNRGEAAEARAKGKTSIAQPAAAAKAAQGEARQAKKVAAMPDFVAPQLCASVERPPNSDGWCHEIKFDGYRVQLRVEDGEAVLKTRKGLDWTDKFGAIAKEAERFPTP